jgi:short-subunit dehydrogenase
MMPATINTPFFDKARTRLGVKPVAPPPVYQPRIVADAILHAAEHRVRDFVVGGAAKALLISQAVSPRLVDALMKKIGFGSTTQTNRSPRKRQTTFSRP